MRTIDLGIFCMQLSLLLRGGIPLLEAIETLEEETKDKKVKAQLAFIKEGIEQGSNLVEVLQETKTFPKYMIHMVQIGTKAGRLEEVLEALGIYYKAEEDIKQDLRSAILYPMILSGMMLAVILVLTTQVLPIFEQVFEGFGGELPFMAKGLMSMGVVMGQGMAIMSIGLMLLLLVIFILLRGERGKSFFRMFFSKGKLSELLATARVASSMQLMLASGLDTLEAMEMSVGLTGHPKVEQCIKNCLKEMEAGEGFIESITRYELFSKTAIRHLKVGLYTGKLDETMAYVATMYEEKLEQGLSKRVGVVEPLAIGVLAMIIGGILLATMLPLMGIMSAMGI